MNGKIDAEIHEKRDSAACEVFLLSEAVRIVQHMMNMKSTSLKLIRTDFYSERFQLRGVDVLLCYNQFYNHLPYKNRALTPTLS